MVVGKLKGGSYEREISVGFSRWVSLGEIDDVFWRAAMSGGRATVARKKGKLLKSSTGDLSAIHPMGQPFLDLFYCECKSYEDLEYASILTGTGHLVKFWKSTVKEAASYGKHPMLIAKQNYRPTLICLQLAGMEALGLVESQCILIAPKISMWGYLFTCFVQNARPVSA